MSHFYILLVLILLFSCTVSQPQEHTYAKQITKERKQKDKKFRKSEHSPLTPEDKKNFAGLHYFAPNLDYKVVAKLERFKDDSIWAFQTSKPIIKKYQRYGKLTFELEKQTFQLLVFKNLTRNDSLLFLPFTDETSGLETYGAGRYINFKIPLENQFVLDFNQAYSPYCAYSDGYSCPIPPQENHLKIKIQAGEKNYHLE